MTSEANKRPAPFIAFYSFKGGVGRSMALINAACILAGHGRRVLAIDLDLEAPGISYLLLRERPKSKPAKGFVDFIYDLLSKKEKSPLVAANSSKALLRYTAELPLPDDLQRVKGGCLRIMPAGRIDKDYERRRQAIDLHRLYLEEKGEPIIRHLRNIILKSGEFDYVLIDSRTGFADEAGVSVRDLADHLVILHGLNHQNIEGTGRFLQRLRKRVPRAKTMKIAFISSPIPLGEDDLCDQRIKSAQNRFRDALGRTVKLELQIPYHPRLALDETPFIFRRTQGALHVAYGRIETLLRDFNSDTWRAWTTQFRKHLKDQKANEAVFCIQMVRTLDEDRAKFLARQAVQDSVGKETFAIFWDFLVSIAGKDVNAYARALEHYKLLGQNDQVERLYREMQPLIARDPNKLHEMAIYYWNEAKNFSVAEELFQKSLALDRRNSPVLCNYGVFLAHERKQHAQAAALYRRAIKAKPDHPRGYVLLADLLADVWKRRSQAERHYRKAVSLAPKEQYALRRLAWLLGEMGRKTREGERFIRQAAELTRNNADTVGSLATFLWRYSKKYTDAKQAYQRAIALDPNNANNIANFAGFTLAHGDLSSAEQQIVDAWALAYTESNQIPAEVAFYRCVQLRLTDRPITVPARYLKLLLTRGYERADWNFDGVLQRAAKKLSADEMRFYTELSKAVLDYKVVNRLERFNNWCELKPLQLAQEI